MTTTQTHSIGPSSSLPTASITLNLSVIRRYVPTAHSVVAVAPYVVLYIFRRALSGWDKCDIEGTLFVLRLESAIPNQESYVLFILNRRGLNNFILPLRTASEVELEDDYLMIQEQVEGGELNVWGMWIFEEIGGSTAGVRKRVGNAVLECAAKVEGAVGVGMDGDSEGGKNGDVDGEGAGLGNGTQQQIHQQNTTADTAGPDLITLLNGSRVMDDDVMKERSLSLD